MARATVMEALSEDYITTARAKGLPERTVLFKHALKNASLPLVTAAALQFGFLLSGAIITETVFSWDGLGYWLYQAIGWRDGPVLQAMFFIIALCVIVANFASDILYGVLDRLGRLAPTVKKDIRLSKTAVQVEDVRGRLDSTRTFQLFRTCRTAHNSVRPPARSRSRGLFTAGVVQVLQ